MSRNPESNNYSIIETKETSITLVDADNNESSESERIAESTEVARLSKDAEKVEKEKEETINEILAKYGVGKFDIKDGDNILEQILEHLNISEKNNEEKEIIIKEIAKALDIKDYEGFRGIMNKHVDSVLKRYGITDFKPGNHNNIDELLVQIYTHLRGIGKSEAEIKKILEEIEKDFKMNFEKAENEFFESIKDKFTSPIFFDSKGKFNRDKFVEHYLKSLKGKDPKISISEFKIQFITENFQNLVYSEGKRLDIMLSSIVERETRRQIMRDYKTFEKEQKEWKEQKEQREKSKQNTTRSEIQNKQTNINNSINYISGKATFAVETTRGTREITLSPEELKVVGKDENIINEISEFYNLLNELGIGELIDYREDIFRAVSEKNGIAFVAYDGDYANSDLEIKIFLNGILESIGMPEIQSANINEFIKEFKGMNKRGFDNEYNRDNIRNESDVEKQFLDRFDFRRNHKFLYETFYNSIS